MALIGAVLASAGARGRITPEIVLLGAGAAGALCAVDTIYALRGTIARVYLMDAVVEAFIVAAWLLSMS